MAAEQGGVRSYIIYLLFINGKMIFHEIVEKTRMSPRHVYRVLQDLKRSRIIDIDHYGYWFLIE